MKRLAKSFAALEGGFRLSTGPTTSTGLSAQAARRCRRQAGLRCRRQSCRCHCRLTKRPAWRRNRAATAVDAGAVTSSVPPLPGAMKNLPVRGLWLIFQASADSRPPDPSRSMLSLVIMRLYDVILWCCCHRRSDVFSIRASASRGLRPGAVWGCVR